MGSFPWQVPEWEDWLSRKYLLATDIYSLGLLIWSVMARGLELTREDLEFLDLAHCSAESKTVQNKVLMLKLEKPLEFLIYLKRSSQRRFALDVDYILIGETLLVTVVKNPDSRNISKLNHLLQNTCMAIQGLSAPDQKSQLRSTSGDTHSNFSPIATISNIENILMAPDMLDTLSPTIRSYATERLERTYQQSEQNEQKATSAFSLAVDALRNSHQPHSENDCLMWLVCSARAGSQSAQSLVVRLHRAFNPHVPLDIQKDFKNWMISAAEHNFPAAQEDPARERSRSISTAF
ncbi:MAG: hypothetical protein MMC33_009431 [Icmadophila ericetorum]|nr:hypothetical protein [Icmadophila ericetorum]